MNIMMVDCNQIPFHQNNTEGFKENILSSNKLKWLKTKSINDKNNKRKLLPNQKFTKNV